MSSPWENENRKSLNPWDSNPPVVVVQTNPAVNPNPWDDTPAWANPSAPTSNANSGAMVFEENIGVAHPVDNSFTQIPDNTPTISQPTKLHLHVSKNSVPFVTFVIINTVLCSIVFILTCWQFQNITQTKAGSSLNALDGGDGCASLPYLPARFRLGTDPHYLQCGWSTRNGGVRFVSALAGALLPLLFLLAVNRKWRSLAFLFSVLALGGAVLFFWIMIIDAGDLKESSSWCRDGLAGLILTPIGIEVTCNYWPYIVTALFDALLIFTWVMVGLLGFRHTFKFMKKL